ncbi:MAG: iron-containing redox enzyme family protein [Polyangiaceae bacterium]
MSHKVPNDAGPSRRDAELEEQAKIIGARTLHLCDDALARGEFFQLLRAHSVSHSLMRYVFLQYMFWRDQLHRWFALCILKSNNCREQDQKSAVLTLAHHILTDLRDDHELMYVDFLHDLGVGDDEIAASRPGLATLAYAQSFFEDFGLGSENLHETIAALSGRELCAAIRNGIILRDYASAYNLRQSEWLVLHERVEQEHYFDAIRPVLIRHGRDPARIDTLMESVARGIERHLRYFDDLLEEHRALSSSHQAD